MSGSAGALIPERGECVGAPVDPDYPVTPVPVAARKTFFSLMVVLLGFTIFTPTMLAGAKLGGEFGLSRMLLIICFGSIILGGYVALIGWIGARTGLTTVVMARFTLGARGSKLASLLLGGTQIGWYGVVIGEIGHLTAAAFGWESFVAKALIMVVASVLMCATACYGYHGMYWVSLLSTPLILVLAFWVMFTAFERGGGWSAIAQIDPHGSMTAATGITIVVGTFISAGTQAPNWTRFARSGGQAVVACIVGFLVGNGLMIFFGAIGSIVFGVGDFVQVLFKLGMVGWGLFLLFGNLWKSNADTAYAFGVAGAEMFERPNKIPFIIGGSIIATVLALIGIADYLPQYLSLLGTFIPPLGGVIIGDYFARWRKTQMLVGSKLPRFHWVNLGVYVVSCFAAWFAPGIPPLVGLVVAVALSLVCARFMPRQSV